MAWTISQESHKKMVHACIDGFPLEACGLFLGSLDHDGKPTGEISFVYPANNSEQSARIYSINTRDMFEATRFADENGWEIIGAYHSHTHTQAYPSPTDIEKAVDPNWCYAIVSLSKEKVESNFFQIINGEVKELDVELVIP